MQPLHFDQEALRRLPLAEAVLLLLRQATLPEHSLELFERLHDRCYQRKISFDLFVALIRDALLSHHGSGRQAFAEARRRGTLEASPQAAYGKLARVPLALSEAFLLDNSQRLLPLLADEQPSPLPASLRRFHCLTVDGKVTKRVAKRLQVLRGLAGGALGGKGLAVVDMSNHLVRALAGCADGHANDAALVPAVVAQVRPLFPPDDEILWVADSQFCDLTQPHRFQGVARGPEGRRDHFLLRYSAKTHFTPDPAGPNAWPTAATTGVDAQGRRWQQEWGWLGREGSRQRLYVRRVTLDRVGEPAITVVTDLLDPLAYPAEDLLECYRLRVGIESVFQQITEVFGLQKLISCRPQGTVFQLCFCLLLYNLMQVVRGHVAVGQGLTTADVSAEMLFRDVQKQLTALVEVVPQAEAVAALVPPGLTPAQVQARLRVLLAGLWKPIWRKASNRKRRPHPNKPKARGHFAVHRVLANNKPQGLPQSAKGRC